MISERFIHIGMGDTGEGIVRKVLHEHLQRPGKVAFAADAAHMSLAASRAICPDAPAFTFVRNPWDWYISRWMHRLRNRRCRQPFATYLTSPTEETMTEKFSWYVGDRPNTVVGRFESLETDLARMLHSLIPDILSEADILGWFPEAWRGWANRAWSESVEQHMRDSLYDRHLAAIVAERDAGIIEEFGYGYEDRYV
jgi:hypothetical protein